MSQTALAELAGCEQSILCRFGNGTRYPSLALAVRLAVALSGDEGERCRLILSAGFVPPSYEVVMLRRKKQTA